MSGGKIIKAHRPDGPGTEAPRAAVTPRPPGTVIQGEVYEAHRSAQSLIAEARARAQEITDAAHREAERSVGEAKQRGHQEGLALAAEHILRAKQARQELLESSEREIVAIALNVAEKIIGRDLERDPALVAEICAAALENVRAANQVIVRVHPEDASTLRDLRRQIMERGGRVQEVVIKEDAEVSRFGCVIETEAVVIDAQLATQFEMLRKVLLAEATAKQEAT